MKWMVGVSISDNNSTASLNSRDYLFLFGLALLVALVIVTLEPIPGYMDADYYYAGGKQLAGGHGFTDPFLWNYLDHPQNLPHPSNSYWYPLASLISAGGLAITGKSNFLSARIGFIILAAFAPLMTAALAFRISRQRQLAMVSGFLAIFSCYYLPFITTTDNYSLYLLVGALYFLLIDRVTISKSILLGVLAGLFNLARGDGLIWLPLTLFVVVALAYRQVRSRSFRNRILPAAANGLLALVGYLLVMGAWFVRNFLVFGTIMPPGSGYVLWMTSYNQIFSFNPEVYTFQSWLESGLLAAVKVRALALWQNLGTAFFAQGMIFLSPLIVVGGWNRRHSFRIQIAFLGWLCILLAESILFPFASVSGGFFHAGTAFQPVWFVLAPIGLDVLLVRIRKRNRKLTTVFKLFNVILVAFMVLFSILLVRMRVVDSGWNEGEPLYLETERILKNQGALPDAVVMVRNPPAYFIMTDRQAIVVPYGDVEMLLAASRKFHASYVILEQIGKNNPLKDLFEFPERYPEFTPLGAIGDNHILFIKPSR
jgi:hypothetical protein